MLDAISSAAVRTNLTNAISVTSGSVSSAATATVASIKGTLPVIPDPTLVKKQIEADAQLKVSQTRETALQAKDTAVALLKGAATTAATSALAGALKFVPKLPLADPKILAALSAAKQIKDLAKERKKTSTQSLTKNKESFKFPLVPPAPTVTLPKVPALPLQAGASLPGINIPRIPPALPIGTTASTSTVSQEVRDDNARKAARRVEIIRIQEGRVARGKRFLDFQADRLKRYPDDASIKSSYENALKVYNNLVTYLEKVKSDSSILELTQ